MGKLTKPKDTIVPNTSTEARIIDLEPDPETLHADFVFIPGPNSQNTIVFLTVGEGRRLIVASRTKDRSQKALEKAWDDVLTPYLQNRIPVLKIMTDNEASLGVSASYLAQKGIKLVQHASEQHEPVVERRVRTIKERMRAVLSELHFDLPLRLYWHLLVWVVQGINITPDTLNTADDVRSARERVSGTRTDARTLRAAFGECVLYHSESNEDCNLSQRSDIGLIVGRNLDSGSHLIWNPLSGSFVERRPFKTIPMPNSTRIIIADVAKHDNPAGKGEAKKNLPRLRKSDHLGGGQFTRVPAELRRSIEADTSGPSSNDPKQPSIEVHDQVPQSVSSSDQEPSRPPIINSGESGNFDGDMEQTTISSDNGTSNSFSEMSSVPTLTSNKRKVNSYHRSRDITKSISIGGPLKSSESSKHISAYRNNGKSSEAETLQKVSGPYSATSGTSNAKIGATPQKSTTKRSKTTLNKGTSNRGRVRHRRGVLAKGDQTSNDTAQPHSPVYLPTSELSSMPEIDVDLNSTHIPKISLPYSESEKQAISAPFQVPNAKGDNPLLADAQEHSSRYPKRVRKPRASDHFALSQMTLTEALRTYPSEGRAAIQAELENLLKYEALEPAPDGYSMSIPCKLFVKEKTKADGSFDKLKGRLVAGGHKQEWDGEDNSSPTVGWETVMMALATAAKFGLHIKVADVTSAYLNAPAEKPVHMTLPPQITSELLQLRPDWSSFAGKGGTMCVRLKKALYGLKDSGKLWYNHISGVLTRAGFTAANQDNCLFKRNSGEKLTAMVLIYVDDLLIITKTTEEGNEIINLLENMYGALTVQSGNEFSFVGTRITLYENGIKVDCQGSIEKLVAFYSAEGTSSNVPTPSDYSVKEESKEIDNKVFHSLVMSIMYIGKRCRPDVLANAAYLSTKINSPNVNDLKAALKTLRYLNSSKEKGILFSKTRQQDLKLSCDAAFNVHCDAKSHTGAVILAGGAPVYYKSSKQKSVSKSSTEAEMIACDTGVDMLLHIAEIAEFMGFGVEYPITIEQDNKSAIFILERGRPTKKRAPIEVKYQYILENIQNGKVCISYVPTEAMVADILTKMLHGTNFRKAAARLLF